MSADWSAAAAAVWGKSCRDDESSWLPLVQHLSDTSAVAGLLWDEWLPASIKNSIEEALPEQAKDGRALTTWLAGLHDVGKASPVFASQVGHLADRMRDYGGGPSPLITPHDQRHFKHAAVGQVVLQDWLMKAHSASSDAASSYAAVVGAHHGQTAATGVLNAIRKRRLLLGTGVWHDIRIEILERITERSGAQQWLPDWMAHELSGQAQMLVTAVVIVADWIASNEELFEYTTYLTDGGVRADRGWEDVALPPPWSAPAGAATQALMAQRFPSLAGFQPRPIQAVAHQAARESVSPALLIVEAAMGQGKTEAALLAAEEFAGRFGSGGIFVGLPTMATSDAMFARVLDWIGNTEGSGATSTFLAHSKAAHNDLWQGLVRQDVKPSGICDEDTLPGQSVATAAAWLSGRKRGVLANFVVGTIDQTLFMALCTKHVMLRHLALAGKVVVLDEVHAADDYMRVYLKRALSWLSSYGVPVVLLSATLPSTVRGELVKAYAEPLGLHPHAESSDNAYPLVTVVDQAGVHRHAVPDSSEPIDLHITHIDDDRDMLTDFLEEKLTDGGCIAVIRNTVSRAQETYRALLESFGNDVVLFHSRFLAPDRSAREAQLRDWLGPDGSNRPQRLIVVGTQVLEQSLDIDFDLMVSDVAPVDLVLQRAGRLHRHQRDSRPAPLATPALVLTGVESWDTQGPLFSSGLAAVYPEALLLRALAVLGIHQRQDTRVITLPTDIRLLVECAYAEVADVPAAWSARLGHADEDWRNSIARAIDKAQGFLLPAPANRSEALHRLLANWTDPHAEDKKGSAVVRDGEDSLEVIVVRRLNGELRTMPGDGEYANRLLSPHFVPEPPVAKSLAGTTLRLPASMCQVWNIDRTIGALEDMGFADWQTSGWLAGQLVLVLDDELEADVAGFHLAYDPALGLTCERGEHDSTVVQPVERAMGRRTSDQRQR